MKRLYEKSEILFSIILIIIYVLGTSVADGVSGQLGFEKSVTVLFHIAFAVLIYIFFGSVKAFKEARFM